MSYQYNDANVTSPRRIRDKDELLEAGISPSLDLAFLDDMDPNIVDGYHLFFEREVPLELRTYDGSNFPTEVGNVEELRIKVFLLGDDKRPEAVRVELTSEHNLFFHYTHDLSYESFIDVQEAQRLMIEFHEYPKLLTRLLSGCLKEPQHCLGILYFTRDKSARLDFVQNMEHKFVELLQVKLIESNEEVLLNAKLSDFNAVVKMKNPSLLLQMKSTRLSPSSSTSKRSFRP